MSIPTYNNDFDDNLIKKNSLLNNPVDINEAVADILNGVSAEFLNQGIFGGAGKESGIEFGSDNAGGSYIQSANFVPGFVAGWRIDSKGNIFCSQLTSAIFQTAVAGNDRIVIRSTEYGSNTPTEIVFYAADGTEVGRVDTTLINPNIYLNLIGLNGVNLIDTTGGVSALLGGTSFDISAITTMGDGGGTNYMEVSATGDVVFVGSAGFYPRRVSQSTEPANGTGSTQIDVGEKIIWHDTDDNKIYLMYNDTTSGIKKIELA